MAAFGLTFDETFVDALARRVAQVVLEAVTREQNVNGWLDLDGAAEYLATTPESIRALVKRKVIPSHKVGGRRLFSPVELDTWVRGERG